MLVNVFRFTLGGFSIVVVVDALSSFVGVTVLVRPTLFVGVVSLFVATCVVLRTGGSEASGLFSVVVVLVVSCESNVAVETWALVMFKGALVELA